MAFSHRIVAIFSAVVLVSGAGLHAADVASAAPNAEIAQLVAQLGAGRYLEREVATERLAEIGIAARPQVEAATRNPDAEIRRRSQLILARIDEIDFRARLTAFAGDFDGSAGTSLPGWERFRARFGEGRVPRSLFVRMQRAERDIMRAYDDLGSRTSLLLEKRCAAAMTRLRTFDGQDYSLESPPVELGSIAALLLLASEKNVTYSSISAQSLSQLMYQPPFANAMSDSAQRPILAKLLGAWIARSTNVASPVGLQNLQLAMQYDIEEGIGPAIDMILHPPGSSAYTLNAMLVVGRFGKAEQLPMLAALLENTTVCAVASVRLPAKDGDKSRQSGPTAEEDETDDGERSRMRRINVEVRDVALAMMVHIAGEELADYGYVAPQAHRTYLFTPQSLYFQDAAARDAALAKWRARK